MTKASLQMREIGKREAATRDMQFRDLQVRKSTIDVDARTIDATVSTPLPVDMPDWSRMEIVPEVLLGSGAIIPKSRQVPFLDSHNRQRVSDQLGSARDLRKDGENTVARLHFSETADAEFTKVREGHVTDVSVGYEVIERKYVAEGEQKKIRGVMYDGPVNVVTKWRVREVSLTPIGADEQAKLRGVNLQANPFESRRGVFKMNEALRALLVSRGMPEDLNDTDAQAWMIDNAEDLFSQVDSQERNEQRQPATPPATTPAQRTSDSGLDAEQVRRLIAEGIQQGLQEQDRQRAAFNAEVDGLCQLAGMPDAAEHCRTLSDVAAVREYLTQQQARNEEQVDTIRSVRITGTGFERLHNDMRSSLTLRCVQSAAQRQETVDTIVPQDQRSKNAAQWRHATIFEMAHELVRAMGVNTRGMTREDIAICAMFGPRQIGLRSSAYHQTGDFTSITLDAMNKSMMVGYTEAPATWRGPMRQGTSTPDFKDIHRVRMGAVANLPVWNDNTDPEKAALRDARETYAVESRSLEVDFSYRLLVNDDMDAFARTAPQLGQAAARTVNAVAWSQVTSNPTMSDGVALFSTATGNRKRANLTTGAGAPATATLQTLTNLMMQMRGENTPEEAESDDVLAIMPAYLVGPSALMTTIEQLVRSTYDPADANMKFNTASRLSTVIEPLLDSSSTTAWYLFASPQQIDTIELSFLQGQESPLVRSSLDYKQLAQSFIVLQTFGAKPLNHRGIQKHAGA
jgi:hypothetical protein